MFPLYCIAGYFLALVGALGFTPLDFVMPILMYAAVRKTSLMWKVFNAMLATTYILVAIVGSIGALYFIVQAASTFQVFANVQPSG